MTAKEYIEKHIEFDLSEADKEVEKLIIETVEGYSSELFAKYCELEKERNHWRALQGATEEEWRLVAGINADLQRQIEEYKASEQELYDDARHWKTRHDEATELIADLQDNILDYLDEIKKLKETSSWKNDGLHT